MFVAAAVCPHPPLLLPEVAQERDGGLDDLRAACLRSVGRLLECRPGVVVCVGAGSRLQADDGSHRGSLRRFGVDVGAGGAGSDDLPLALTVGGWLLDRSGWTGPRRYVALPPETTPQSCAEMGSTVAGADLRVGVLALGDGSARRSRDSPGYLDGRAEPFDATVAQALAEPDPPALEGLAPDLCAELWVAGRQAWQFLAGASASRAKGAEVEATLRYDAAPFGVGYFVADWTATAQ